MGAGITMFDDLTVGSQEAYIYRVVALRDNSLSDYSDESSEVTSAGLTARFTNLSNRALVGTGDDILISSAVGEQLRPDVSIQAVEPMQLRGKSEPVELYAVEKSK